MSKSLLLLVVSIVLTGFACVPQEGSNRPVSEAERLFRNRCTVCHRLPQVKRNDWHAVLEKHTKRAHLNAQQKKMLVEFFNSLKND